MGSGKSSAAITYMNEHKRDKFIYITPYLDEAERIKDGCPALRFAEPSNKIEKYHFKKTEHTAGLIKLGRNITSTHQAFKRYTKEMLDDIRNYGYTLIIDENVDVLESFEFHKDDLKLAVDAGYVKEENGTYSLVKDDYKGVAFQDMFSLLNCRTLIKVEDKDSLINETLFFWSLPPELITSFKDVIVLTYLFNVQNLRYFFDINKIKYEFVGVECKNGKYRFCADTSNIPNHIGNLREMINILDNDKLNEIGEDKYALVTVDGGVYGEFPLSEDTVVSVDELLGHNTIVISRGQVCISEADCPDRYCVKHSAVSKIGETIICLPHKLVVEIKSYGKGAADTGVDAVVQ